MKTRTQTTLAATVTCLMLSAFVFTSFAKAKTLPPHPLFGVTIENLETFNTNQLKDLIKGKSLPLTVRVIFQNEMLPADYLQKLKEIEKLNPADGKKIFVLGTLYDSEYLDDYKIKYPLKPEDKLNCDKLRRKSTDYQPRSPLPHPSPLPGGEGENTRGRGVRTSGRDVRVPNGPAILSAKDLIASLKISGRLQASAKPYPSTPCDRYRTLAGRPN